MTDVEWEELRLEEDPDSLAVIKAVMDSAGGNDMSRLHFLHEVDHVDDDGLKPLPEDLPQAVKDYFNDTSTPDWFAEYGDIEAARRRAIDIFDEDIVAFIIALLCKALPECYAGANGAEVLAYTGQLGEPNYTDPKMRDTLVRRVVETAVFVHNVNHESYWEGANHRAVRTIRKVRLFHSGIRLMIERHDAQGIRDWDFDKLGAPINQQDLVSTLMAFSLLSIRGVRRMGVKLSTEDEEALMLHWALVGHHLGIKESILRDFIEDAGALWERTIETQFAPSEAGASLTGALAYFMSTHIFVVEHKAHLPILLMRKMMDPRAQPCVHLDRLGPAYDTKFYESVGWIIHIIHNLLLDIPFLGKWILDKIGDEVMELTIEGWAGSRHPRVTLSKELEED